MTKHHGRIWILQHTPSEGPALLGRTLTEARLDWRLIRLDRNEALPTPDASVTGLISLGGDMSANDESTYPWIAGEIALMQEFLKENKPIVGLCLGGQLLARALGAKVSRASEPELGWHPIAPTAGADHETLFGGLHEPARVLQWHYDTFELPEGAVRLAASRGCANQAFRYGENAYGLQFHAEGDASLVEEWLALPEVAEELKRAKGPFVQSAAEIRAGISLGERTSRMFCERITKWLASLESRAAA